MEPNGFYPELELNNYGNFTLSGTNLNNLRLNSECNLKIEHNTNSKYSSTYSLVGYGGISIGEDKIVIDPNYESEILCRLMSKSQASNVNQAYPNFVEMVLNGKENEIDYKKIKNVAKVRLADYIKKVKEDCKSIVFIPTLSRYGIKTNAAIARIVDTFNSPKDFEENLKQRPYFYYSNAFKDGVSFYRIDELVKKYFPNFIDSEERCYYACIQALKDVEDEGNTCVKLTDLVDFIDKNFHECANHTISLVKSNEYFYYEESSGFVSTKSIYQHEKNIARNILQRVNSKCECFDNPYTNYMEINGFNCTEEQGKILKLVASGERIVMLTGSAGTGKTTSIKALISMLEDNNKTYTLLAPTGIAAKRLRESTGRKANTIHMALFLRPYSGVNYIIIDECSMVGVELLSILLDTVDQETSLILVCDNYQLASISCGNIVQDILDSKIVPTANLTKVFRYGIGGIDTIATDIRNGEFDEQKIKSKNYSDLKFENLSAETEDAFVDQIIRQYQTLLNAGYKKEDILILSPFKKGAFGTFKINEIIQKHFNLNDYLNAEFTVNGNTVAFKMGDKVINIHNTYDLRTIDNSTISVMNGDIGYIRGFNTDENGKAILDVEFDSGIGEYIGEDIRQLYPGYAISVHKIQGSQSKAVIVVLHHSHFTLLSRNLLYVAFSRAQKYMVILSDPGVIKNGIKVQENLIRSTWLYNLLKKGGEILDEI